MTALHTEIDVTKRHWGAEPHQFFRREVGSQWAHPALRLCAAPAASSKRALWRSAHRGWVLSVPLKRPDTPPLHTTPPSLLCSNRRTKALFHLLQHSALEKQLAAILLDVPLHLKCFCQELSFTPLLKDVPPLRNLFFLSRTHTTIVHVSNNLELQLTL